MKKFFLVIIAVTMVALYSCQDKESMAELQEMKDQLALLEQNKAVAERFHTDLSVKRNWAVAEEILAPDVVIHDPAGENIVGIEQVKQLDAMYESMPNMKINHYEIIAEGDYVFIRWDVAFDNNVDLMGIPATGKHISGIYGMDLFRLKDGKITDMWQNYDQLGFMQQLGAIPAP